jgi:hypothetical protein
MIAPNMRKQYSFNIIARVDIPWGIDITEKVLVNIDNEKTNKPNN